MAAPAGNKNRAKSAAWADAIKRALAIYEDSGRGIEAGQALHAIARTLVASALDGDRDAMKEIGERLDGKATQHIDANINFLDRLTESEQLGLLAALDALAGESAGADDRTALPN